MKKNKFKNIIIIIKTVKTIRLIVLVILFYTIIVGLFACKEKIEEEIIESSTEYIIEAANQFAIDKETETEMAEETKAHHIYPEISLSADKQVVIGEKQFLTKINYIYNHIEKFSNTVVEVEGMYGWYKSWDGTFEFPMIYRNGPGCCGDDQYGGFFLVNISQETYNIDDWLTIKGVPFMYEHIDSEGELQKFLFLLVSEVKLDSVKDRKAEMVND